MPRAPKHCGAPGCDQKVIGVAYCRRHEVEAQQRADKQRGNARQRGYDTQHDQEAIAAKAAAITAAALCPRCGAPMLPGQELDYGHTIARVNGGGRADRVEHAHCNRQAQHRHD